MQFTRFVALFVLVFAAGCVHRQNLNTNCEWPYKNQTRLDLRNDADRSRLRDEVHLAEELAIRNMDERRRSEGQDAGRRGLRPCMDALFARIATLNGVGIDDIERARTQRNRTADIVFVVLPMTTLFVLISNRLSRRILLSIDAGMLAACVTLVASVLVTVCMVMVGGVWAGFVEMLRIGNSHLSFRSARIPWPSEYVFVAWLLVYWLIAGIQHRIGSSLPKGSDAIGFLRPADCGKTPGLDH